jgi:hypothetical protein
LIVCATALAVVAFIVLPWVPAVCPMRLLLQVPCPSCGLTRAARCLFHADLAGATRMHPLWWLVFPYVGTLAVMESVSFVRTGTMGRWAQSRASHQMGAALLALLVVVWGARALGAFGGPVPLN